MSGSIEHNTICVICEEPINEQDDDNKVPYEDGYAHENCIIPLF